MDPSGKTIRDFFIVSKKDPSGIEILDFFIKPSSKKLLNLKGI